MAEPPPVSPARPAPVASGYGHVVTPEDRARWQRWHDALAQESYRRGMEAVEGGDRAAALFWLGRAARMARFDPNVIFSYGMALLSAGHWEEAAGRMGWIARRFIIRKAPIARAIALQRLGRESEAVSLFGQMLQSYAPSPEGRNWATFFCKRSGAPGWCACSNDGIVVGESEADVAVFLDGHCVAQDLSLPFVLPELWRVARQLEIRCADRLLYGAPVHLEALRRVQGFVTISRDRLEGWIWYPADPDFTPDVLISCGDVTISIRADQIEPAARIEKPLARPRRFDVPLASLPDATIEVTDRYGQPLTGSPIGPVARRLLDQTETGPVSRPVEERGMHLRERDARVSGSLADGSLATGFPATGNTAIRNTASGCLIVIPVYRDFEMTRRCIEAALAAAPSDTECLVIDDASPEPALAAYLDLCAGSGRITLIRHDVNRGFTASANAGLSRAGGRDTILLNSDALMPPGGIARLRGWLARAPDIGTATPFSNDATILSYPSVRRPNPTPDLPTARALDRVFESLPSSEPVFLPTGNGFCMAIRGACLTQVGLLDVGVFAQGYGEENDFCCRASALGWRHVAATDLYVVHAGSVSFGRTRSLLLARNLRMLNRLHPGYDALVAAFIEADPLAVPRRSAALVRMLSRRGAYEHCLIMVTHDSGGGVERVVRDRQKAAEAAGAQVLIVRPHEKGCRIEDCGGDTDNLVFSLPDEWDDLIVVLRRMQAARIEWHHLLGHAPCMRALAQSLGLEWDIVLHDYVWFCPRICLIGPHGRYCGEPDIAGCQSCIDTQGSLLDADMPVAELVARSHRELDAARIVIAGSEDLQRRMRRHFPGLPVSVEPFESDALPPVRRRPQQGQNRRRICIAGAIGREKGFEIVHELARDAAARDLPLEYYVAGYTIDDDLLMKTGRVLVTGEFREDEAVSLIGSLGCDFGLVPSIWPETWCFALSNLMHAGLQVVSFDIGAQSERLRKTGRGPVVPLGMPIPLLSHFLLHLSR
ncbi:glycosyltransferase [Swaminathania salitolerans]|uniref:glycosyltransferase n=1 Tax=Swaminathania salitolerans TaxID=182838 RepID=UPI0011BE9600|nr:glycosyltransferase [Swaminathania salitolerans]